MVTVVDTESSSSRRAKVNVERALWASALIAGGVGVLGWWNPQGWKLLETVVGYPALWVSAAFVLLTISTFGRRALFLQVVAVCVTCAVCLVGVGLTALGIRTTRVRLPASTRE